MTLKTSLNKVLAGAFFLSAVASAFTNIALGEESHAEKALNHIEKQVESMVDQVAGAQTPGKMISDGNKFDVARVGIKIAAPQGWEVITNHPTMSLITQEPAQEKVEYDVAQYQRNITVSGIHGGAPIDEQRATKLREELTSTFGKEGVAKNFTILEHKFFDYKAKNDGLVMFSQFETGEFKMMQMHVLVSGESMQVLMTYTDLQDRFSGADSYASAWNAMVGVEVMGQAPHRYRDLIINSAIGGLVLILMLSFWILRKRRQKNQFSADADVIYSDDDAGDFSFQDTARSSASSNSHKRSSARNDIDFPVTQTGVWNLLSVAAEPLKAQKSRGEEEEGFSFVTGF